MKSFIFTEDDRKGTKISEKEKIGNEEYNGIQK